MVNSHLSEMEQVLKEMKRRTDGLESPLEMGENPYTMTLDPTLTCDQESITSNSSPQHCSSFAFEFVVRDFTLQSQLISNNKS